MLLKLASVFLAGSGRINEQGSPRLKVLEHRRSLEFEAQFGRIEQLKHDNLMAARRQRGEVSREPIQRGQEIRKNHNKATFAHDLEKMLERRTQVGRLARRRFFQCQHQMSQMTRAMTSWQIVAYLLGERQQAHCVSLKV